MCKRNSPDKNEGSTGYVRETPEINMKPARGRVRETPQHKNEGSTGYVRETPEINMKPARGRVRETPQHKKKPAQDV